MRTDCALRGYLGEDEANSGLCKSDSRLRLDLNRLVGVLFGGSTVRTLGEYMYLDGELLRYDDD